VGDKEISFILPAEERIFSSQKRRTNTGPHPASYPMGTENPSPGLKRPDHEAKHAPSSCAVVQYASSLNSISP